MAVARRLAAEGEFEVACASLPRRARARARALARGGVLQLFSLAWGGVARSGAPTGAAPHQQKVFFHSPVNQGRKAPKLSNPKALSVLLCLCVCVCAERGQTWPCSHSGQRLSAYGRVRLDNHRSHRFCQLQFAVVQFLFFISSLQPDPGKNAVL